MEQIKERILKAMELRDMTASELAKRSGIGKGSISKYLKGTVISSSPPKESAQPQGFERFLFFLW